MHAYIADVGVDWSLEDFLMNFILQFTLLIFRFGFIKLFTFNADYQRYKKSSKIQNVQSFYDMKLMIIKYSH